jgi:hypothetical protein
LRAEATEIEHKRLAEDRKVKSLSFEESNTADKSIIEGDRESILKFVKMLLACFIVSNLI